jgi:lipid A 3-O-deacylase
MQPCLPPSIRIPRRSHAIPTILLAVAALAGRTCAGELLREPDTAYVQAGAGDNVASGTVGVTWDLPWRHENDWGLWEAYLDLSLGRWHVSSGRAKSGHGNVTQVGITPAIRLRPTGWNHFFVEAGIGANWIFPVYQNDPHQFSTTFNFGDHLAAGWQFGPSGEQELTLRLQHFSNAGIKHPNPGENFVQLRYARRF